MSTNIYGANALIGGGTGALDAIDGASLADKDSAIVLVQGGETYHYTLDADSGETGSSPDIIAPVANAGDKRWILQNVHHTLSPITITSTGTPAQHFVCNVTQPMGVQIDDTLYTASGKWVEGFGDVAGGVGLNTDGYLTLDFPDLVGVRNDVNFSYTGVDTVTSLVADALVVVGGSFAVDTLESMTSLDLSSLAAVGKNFAPKTLTSLDTLDIASLSVIGGSFSLENMPALTSVVLTDITKICSAPAITLTTGLAAMTTFTLGSGLLSVGGNVTITSPTLAEASVNNTLIRLAALDGTGGTTLYTGMTVDLSGNCAPPGATGWAARLTLIAATNTVVVNGNFAITAAAAAPTNTFTIAGDKTTIFVAGTTFVVAGSAANDGTYTVSSSAFGAATVITVNEAVTGNGGGGSITTITSA